MDAVFAVVDDGGAVAFFSGIVRASGTMKTSLDNRKRGAGGDEFLQLGEEDVGKLAAEGAGESGCEGSLGVSANEGGEHSAAFAGDSETLGE